MLRLTRAGAVKARRVALQLIQSHAVSAPDEVRDQVRNLSRMQRIRTCAAWRLLPARPGGPSSRSTAPLARTPAIANRASAPHAPGRPSAAGTPPYSLRGYSDNEVRGRTRVAIPSRRPRSPSTRDPLDPGPAHEPRDPLAADPYAIGGELGVGDPRNPVGPSRALVDLPMILPRLSSVSSAQDRVNGSRWHHA